MTDRPDPRGRLQLGLLAAIFFGPLAVAAWLYYQGGDLQPEGRANHGVLLEPYVNVDTDVDGAPLAALHDGAWLLLYAYDGPCEADCREGLYTTRQMRLMLGREMDRLGRIFLHGPEAPDTVFLAAEHEGLVALQDGGLADLIGTKTPASALPGGYYLIDPIGNLVMYFPPDLAPKDIVADLKRLLKLSRIG